MMKPGKCDLYHIGRLLVTVVSSSTIFERCGIEGEWGILPDALCRNNVRILSSDDYLSLLWDLGFASLRHMIMRNLSIEVGYPRRFTLILDDDFGVGLIKTFKADLSNFRDVTSGDADYSKPRFRRSCFIKLPVKQIELCLIKDEVEQLKIDGWAETIKKQKLEAAAKALAEAAAVAAKGGSGTSN